jgi:hypothetical protein
MDKKILKRGCDGAGGAKSVDWTCQGSLTAVPYMDKTKPAAFNGNRKAR